MQSHNLAVVGSGIGGSIIASLNTNIDTILFEKEAYLGGCASTFIRKGQKYNTGATTFVGYEDKHIVKELFDKAGVAPDIKQSDIAIRIIQKEKIIDRTDDFEDFLEQIDSVFPNKNNAKFWNTMRQIDKDFWEDYDFYIGKYSLKRYSKTFLSVFNLGLRFKNLLFKNAKEYIDEMFPNISSDYLDFIDAQLLITVQAKSSDVTLLSMALGLSYPFHKVYYANGGMGRIIDDLTKNVNLHKKEPIISIKKHKDYYLLHSKKAQYKSKSIVLNSSIFNSGTLFEDTQIQKYYDQFSLSDQSAFVLYLHIDSKEDFLHHYQIILDDYLPHCISKSFFVSFSDKYDEQLCSNGYTITISTHTKALYWKKLSKEEYNQQKQYLQDFLLKNLLAIFQNINKEDIINCFSATSITFNRYINRLNCGGEAISFKNILSTPTQTTPFKGLYNVGDTLMTGQGWPGVALGANILQKELDEYHRT